MLNCHDVAKYFLTKVDEEAGDSISHLKLQKLVYYAQGLHLALYDEPLFMEPIEAWLHGPVIGLLYDDYKQYANNPIARPQDVNFSVYDDQISNLLDEVYSYFGQFSAGKLRNMTHEEDPWKNAPSSGVISLSSMKQYFKAWLEKFPGKIRVVYSSDKVSLIEKFEALADQWYREVGGFSFVAEKSKHPAYQQIIDMGSTVVPLLLRELEQKPNHWFEALRVITGANPIQPEQRGRTKQMAAAWLKWGREHGYEW